MKPTLLLGCILLAGSAAHAQISLLPYAGFEQSKSTLGYGNALSTADINGNLKAGLKMDYRLKGGHSPFINLTTSPAPVSFAFDNAGTLLNSFQQKGLLFRLEGGYQFSSKPLFFGKKSTPSTVSFLSPTQMNTRQRTACNTLRRFRCGERKSLLKTAPVNKALNMRLQPSLALAYVPAALQQQKQTAGGFEYAAGSWKTALVPSLGFEFAKGNQRLFTLNVFYTRPLAQNNTNVNTVSEGKPYTYNFAPTASTWGLTLGVPFGTAKPKAVKQQTEKRQCVRHYCRRYMHL